MLNRLQPVLPVGSYDTYEIRAPRATHTRPATCDEVDCEAWRNGWVTVVDQSTDLGARQAAYIRGDRTRGKREGRTPKGWVEFTFAPGNRCFREHTIALDRPAIYVVGRGDWRGLTGQKVVPGEEWLHRFEDNQGALKEQIEKG